MGLINWGSVGQPSTTGGGGVTSGGLVNWGGLAASSRAASKTVGVAKQSEQQILRQQQLAKGINNPSSLINLQAELHNKQITPAKFTQQFPKASLEKGGADANGDRPVTPFKVTPGAIAGAAGNAIKNVGTGLVKGTVQSEGTVAKVGARLLPGGQNDLAAENQATNSGLKSQQFINGLLQSKKITPQQAIKIQKSVIQPGLQENSQNIKQTAASIPTRGQTAAGVVGTAADILSGGTLPEIKGASTVAKVDKAITTPAALATASGANAAAGGGTKKQVAENAFAGAALPLAAEGVAKGATKLGATLKSKTIPLSEASGGTKVAPIDTSKPLSQAETAPKAPMNEAGGIPVGEVVGNVQDMVAKHQAVTKATGDIEHDYAINQGVKQDVNQDAATVLKNRTPLSNDDKQTLQAYRDAKSAGLTPEELPQHLQEANDNITALNKAAQTNDATKARLTGNDVKAQAIEARDPEAYTHREAIGKGSNLELTIRGDKDDPLAGGQLAKSTSSSNKRTLLNATDEDGNRQVVSVSKGRVTGLSDEGNTTQDLGNLNLKSNQDFLDKELKPYQAKVSNLQKEGDALSKVKTKGGVSDARITALARKASLLEDPGNMSTLSTSEARSLHDAKLKLRELTNVKEPGTNVSGRLQTINRHLIDMNNQINEITNKYDPENLEQKAFVGKDGKKYTLGQATQDEITKSTGTKYYTDPELTSTLNYVASKRALENTRFIENTKSILEDKNLAYKDGETAPKNFVKTNNPYFPGYKLDPKIAEQLDDIVGKSSNVTGKAFNKIGNFLKQTIVYLPIKHNFNELAGYAIDRGLSKMVNPLTYPKMAKSLVSAGKSVATHDDFYRSVLKSDFNMMGADDKALGKVVAKQLKTTLDNPERVKQFAKDFGMSPVRAYKALQHVSVYDAQDVLNLARINERMRPGLLSKGMSLEDAVKATAKTNFQYRVPSRVALPGKVGRAASETLNSNKIYFGHYTYDKYRIAKNIVKGTVNVSKPKEALQSADKLAATVAISALLWPQVNKLLQHETGDKNAHITAPGVSGISEVAQKVASGKEGATSAAGSQVSVAAPITIGAQLLGNRNSFTGDEIHDPNASTGTKAKQTLSFLGGQVAPNQKLTTSKNATANKGISTFLSLAGASLPKSSPQDNKLNSLKFDTLPKTQSSAKGLAAKGDIQGAISAISKYNKGVTKAVQAAAKADGKPVPSSAQLKSQGYYYDPSLSTIEGWQTGKTSAGTLDKILNTKVAPTKGQPGYKQYEKSKAIKAKITKAYNKAHPQQNKPVVALP